MLVSVKHARAVFSEDVDADLDKKRCQVIRLEASGRLDYEFIFQ